MMEYKGYKANIEFDSEKRILIGSVIDLEDVVLFQGDSIAELEADFREAVDTYLEMCAEEGQLPEKPYSGKLNLRLTSEQHRAAARAARQQKRSLNDLILQALTQYLYSQPKHVDEIRADAPNQHGILATKPRGGTVRKQYQHKSDSMAIKRKAKV